MPLEREIGRPLREAGLLDLRDPDRLAGLARQAEQQLLAQLAGSSESSARGTSISRVED